MNHQSQNGREDRFDVVALIASAGGHLAIPTLLRDLPADFSVPIILMQHLGSDAAGTLNVYARAVRFAVEWVTSGAAVASRTLLPEFQSWTATGGATCRVTRAGSVANRRRG
jgi:chemotaxis response regulator CheB